MANLCVTQSGSNLIEIKGLSSSIDTESFRVSGLGSVRLADVVCVVDSSALSGYQNRNENQAVRDASLRIKDLAFEKKTRQGEVDMLLRYGQALGGTVVPPDQVTAFADTVLTKTLAAAKIIRELESQIEELETVVQLNQKPIKGETRGKATITIVAQSDGMVHLTVSYRAYIQIICLSS